jgi:hypothetical protein
MSKNDRKLSNFLLTPQFQLKLTYYYIGGGLLLIFGTAVTVFYKMSLVRNIMNNAIATDFSAQSQISEHMFHIAQIYMVGFVTFTIASFIFALMVSHRIAGPVVAISAFIEELRKVTMNTNGIYDLVMSSR